MREVQREFSDKPKKPEGPGDRKFGRLFDFGLGRADLGFLEGMHLLCPSGIGVSARDR
jgi:hypothetical protein